jgi:hypothetical protein
VLVDERRPFPQLLIWWNLLALVSIPALIALAGPIALVLLGLLVCIQLFVALPMLALTFTTTGGRAKCLAWGW